MVPACESKISIPFAGTTALNQTSPPEYKPHPGAGVPTVELVVASALEKADVMQLTPTVNGIAVVHSSLKADRVVPEPARGPNVLYIGPPRHEVELKAKIK